jgi:peptidoglycan/xylan/chitin deacetylase (PgdA/CDA1 family)
VNASEIRDHFPSAVKTGARPRVPILAFHKVDPRFEWGVTRTTPKQFRKILHFLKSNGYQTVSLRDLLYPNSPLPEKPVVLTFDDSYESLYEHACPAMMEYGFTGAVFVITDYIGALNRWDVNLGWLAFSHLAWDQILEMRKYGFEFGSHTHRHPDLTRVSDERIVHELEYSKKILEDRLGEEVPFISFPFGRYNENVVRKSKEAGYKRACAFWNSLKKSEESFVFERMAYYLFDTTWNLKAKLGHNLWTHCEVAKLRVINFCSHGTSLVKPAS